MKTRTKHHRKIKAITTGRRWSTYAAAAAATSFAVGQSAEASIHYSGLVNQKIGGRDSATFPLDPAGGSFVVDHYNYVGGSSSYNDGGFARLNVYGVASASVNGAQGCHEDSVCVSKLNRGEAISVGPFQPKGGILAEDSYFLGWSSWGNFRDRGVGLAGFKFNNGAGDQYGWVRVKMLGGRKNMVEVIDYAYGDPGDTVFAGQKSDGSAPALESLGALALGGTALLAWRRRAR